MGNKDNALLIKPSASLRGCLEPLFKAISIVEVKSAREALEKINNNTLPLIIPSKLLDNSNGIAACAQVRAENELVPIAAYLPQFERSLTRTFYEVGANFVFSAPFKEEEVALQIKGITESINKAFSYNTKFLLNSDKSPLITSFNSLNEGVVILDSSFTPIFANKSYLRMVKADCAEISGLELKKTLLSLLPQLEKGRNKLGQGEIVRIDGTTFKAAYKGVPLNGESLAGGTAIIILDLSSLSQLQSILLSAHRTKKIALLGLAAAFSALSKDFSSPILRSIPTLETMLAKQKKFALVEPVLTTLLDVIDLIVEPGVNVKVSCVPNVAVCTAPGNLVLLLGQLILFASEFASPVGDVSIDVGSPVPGEGVTILITSEPTSPTLYLPEDPVTKLIFHQSLTNGAENGDQEKARLNWLKLILSDAQQIADIYRTKIEYKIKSASIALRVKLPPAWKRD